MVDNCNKVDFSSKATILGYEEAVRTGFKGTINAWAALKKPVTDGNAAFDK